MSAFALTKVVDEPGLRRRHDIVRASLDADFVGLPADPVAEMRPALAGPYGDEDHRLFIGEVDGVPVGSVDLRLPIHDNLDLANIAINVPPEQRSRGYGRLSLQAALSEVRTIGRRKVLFEIPSATRSSNPAPAQRFARSVGARPMITSTRRMLAVDAVSATRLAALLADAKNASAGYSTVAWGDHTPPEWVSDMANLRVLMSTDPPQGELRLEPEFWDADRYLEQERSYIERGRQHLVSAVRDDATGRLVGYTDIGVPAAGSVGFQWDTIVRSEHRGHRLGLLLKLANLAELRHRLPAVRAVNTWNADDNTHMMAVNEALGFTAMEQWTEWQLDL